MEYRVLLTKDVPPALRRLRHEAVIRGVESEVWADLRRLEERMRTGPLQNGDPAYALPSGRAVICRDMQGIVCCYYAVYEDEGVVYVYSVLWGSFPGE